MKKVYSKAPVSKRKVATGSTGLALKAKSVRADARQRISLGRVLTRNGASTFDVYTDRQGRIVLDPQISIPASEAWVFDNPAILRSIKRGLADAAAGRVSRHSSLSSLLKSL